jgi:hypothetical protein
MSLRSISTPAPGHLMPSSPAYGMEPQRHFHQVPAATVKIDDKEVADGPGG